MKVKDLSQGHKFRLTDGSGDDIWVFTSVITTGRHLYHTIVDIRTGQLWIVDDMTAEWEVEYIDDPKIISEAIGQ